MSAVYVSQEFVKNAEALAKAVPQLTEELAAAQAHTKNASAGISALADAAAETLVLQGLVEPAQKSAAAKSLTNHTHALEALNKVAQVKRSSTPMTGVAPISMGAPVEKKASAMLDSNGDELRESDTAFFKNIGLL
jgi:hypothetical protein